MPTVDKSNIIRVDLDQIYDSIKRRSHYRAKLEPNAVDVISISGDDIGILHEFVKQGAADIATRGGYLSEADDTSGIDELTGEEGLADLGTIVIYNIEDLEEDTHKRSSQHELIHKALIHYVLREWYDMIGMGEDAKGHHYKFEDAMESLHSNRLRRGAAKNKPKQRYRPL